MVTTGTCACTSAPSLLYPLPLIQCSPIRKVKYLTPLDSISSFNSTDVHRDMRVYVTEGDSNIVLWAKEIPTCWRQPLINDTGTVPHRRRNRRTCRGEFSTGFIAWILKCVCSMHQPTPYDGSSNAGWYIRIHSLTLAPGIFIPQVPALLWSCPLSAHLSFALH